MAQLVGVSLRNLRVAGLIPSQGTYLGCRFDPQSGSIQEATNPHFSLSKSNEKMSSGEDLKKIFF